MALVAGGLTRATTSPPPLGAPIGAGGEAEVFAVAGRSRVAYKRYRAPSPARSAKLRVMTAHPPEGLDDGGHVAIAWPLEIVERDGVALGFTMARIDTSSTVPLFQVYNPQSRRQVAPAFSWQYLLRTARNVAAIVDAVHRAGYVIGDLNESNFLVSKRALVTLVDCDSLQVVDPTTGEVHGCGVGKPEFLAPELQRADLAVTARTEASDRFALAVLLHLILLEGGHPFAGIWRGRGEPPDIGERIARRAAAHRRASPVDPPPFALALNTVPPAMRRLFQRGLGRGLRRPEARPSAAQWVEALDAAEDALATCDRSPHHRFGSHLRRCPWCARRGRGLPDPFPGPDGGDGVDPPPATPGECMRLVVRRLSAQARRAAGGAFARLGRRVHATVVALAQVLERSSFPLWVMAGAAGVVAPVAASLLAGVVVIVRTRVRGAIPLLAVLLAALGSGGAAALVVAETLTWSVEAGVRTGAAVWAVASVSFVPPMVRRIFGSAPRRDRRRRSMVALDGQRRVLGAVASVWRVARWIVCASTVGLAVVARLSAWWPIGPGLP